MTFREELVRSSSVMECHTTSGICLNRPANTGYCAIALTKWSLCRP